MPARVSQPRAPGRDNGSPTPLPHPHPTLRSAPRDPRAERINAAAAGGQFTIVQIGKKD